MDFDPGLQCAVWFCNRSFKQKIRECEHNRFLSKLRIVSEIDFFATVSRSFVSVLLNHMHPRDSKMVVCNKPETKS